MPKGHNAPSLYEMLSGNFSGGLSLSQVSEQNQVILSVLDNMQRILNCRAGTLAHLPDYGLPDLTKLLQGMPGTAHQLITTLRPKSGRFVSGWRILRSKSLHGLKVLVLKYFYLKNISPI